MRAKTLRKVLEANRAGRPVGVYSVCSAHCLAVEAAIQQSSQDDGLVLIEATANQVNQYGGYSGMRPSQFRDRVHGIARRSGVSSHKLVLGGDHLGPVCWASETADHAMVKASELVAAYSAAGFRKLHLDTSMPCIDDSRPLAQETIAQRAAALCKTAERAAMDNRGTQELLYVIGSEVPTPGGAVDGTSEVWVTEATTAKHSIEAHERAFRLAGVQDAWERVIALVVQPGIEFDNGSVREYKPYEAKPLRELIAAVPNLVFEAHSTDYQVQEVYSALIRDHFAILKVGPELTYAVREALFALSHIEYELLPPAERANLRDVCEHVMLSDPAHWRRYCPDGESEARVARQFGYSDRIRYYWNHRNVRDAVQRLFRNLSRRNIPLPLLEQYMPLQYEMVRRGKLNTDPRQLVSDRVMRVTQRYSRACQGH